MWYSRFLERVVVPVVGRIQGIPVDRYWRQLEESQWWSPEEIRALQWRKLKRLLDHAYERVPYYRRRMDEAGVTPADIQTWEDVARLPISTKEDVRAAFPHDTVARGADTKKLILYASSGSTGEPFRYYISREEKARRWAIVFRYWSWAGLLPGIPYANLTGEAPGAFKRNRRLKGVEHWGMRVLELPAFGLYEGNVAHYVDRIRRFRPRLMRGYASTMYYLARYLKGAGESLPLQAVLTMGETLYPHQRALIEETFGCPVYDVYGGEAMEAAAQCGHHRGYHINAESILVEVVGQEGQPLPPGERGQLVLTNLDNYAMPFIRYNIQDVGTLSQEMCPCGRGLPLLESVEGRLTDIFVTPSGKILVVHFFTLLLMRAEGVEQYQVVQERPERIVLRLVPNERYTRQEEESLLSRIRQYVGPDVEVVTELVDSIPLTRTGKRRFFISQVASEELARSLNAPAVGQAGQEGPGA